MISKKEVEHIAKLARLELSAKEMGKIKKELSSILDYMEILKEVNINGVKPTSHSIEVKNVMREDKSFNSGISKELVEMAPAKKENYLKVKSVL